MTTTTEQRVKWALFALDSHLAIKGTEREFKEPLDYEISDLIADLLHLAERHNYKPENILWTARNHYDEEHKK